MTETVISERDAVMRERAAAERWYCATWDQAMEGAHDSSLVTDSDSRARLRKSIAKAYPLPKVPRPREVPIGSWYYRVREGRIEFRQPNGQWTVFGGGIAIDGKSGVSVSSGFGPTALREFADLLENPDELVDAE